MEPDGFKRMVAEDAGGMGMPQWALAGAASYFIERDLTSRDDVAECIKLARRFIESFLTSLGLTKTPGLLIGSNQVVEAIRPAIEATRRSLFGSVKAPFGTREAAAGWIRTEAERTTRAEGEDSEEAERLHVEIAQRLRQYGRLVGREVRMSERPRLLSFFEVNDQSSVRTVTVFREDTPLAALERTSRRLAEGTGFSPEAVLAHVLTGEVPILPPANLSIRYRRPGGGLQVKAAVVEVLTREVTLPQLREIHRLIRAQTNVVRAKPLTERHREVLDLVSRLERQGTRGRREPKEAFWRRAQKEWNETHGKQYRSWRGLQMLYVRTQRKLNGPSGVSRETRNQPDARSTHNRRR